MLTNPPVPFDLVGAFSVIIQPVVEPMEHYTALVKAANEAEAEKFEEQLRVVQKKIQAMESQFDVSTEVQQIIFGFQ